MKWTLEDLYRAQDYVTATIPAEALRALLELVEADLRMEAFADDNGDLSDPEAQRIEDQHRKALSVFKEPNR